MKRVKFRSPIRKRASTILSCLLAACIMSSLISSPVFAYPTNYNTGVPMTHQVKDHWCWAACGAAIVNYYGGSITQYNFSSIVKGNTTNNVGATLSEEIYGLNHYGIHTNGFTGTLTYQSIQQNSYSWHRPVVAGLLASAGSTNTYNATGHMTVITGYMSTSGDPNTVVLMDPWFYNYQYKLYSFITNSNNGDYYWYQTIDQVY